MDLQARFAWSLWAANSQYSPLNLRHLPQPIPNDCPPDAEPAVFTFEDAFEDLLAVSAGRPLPDIHSRYQMGKMLRHMFPTGEDASFYVERLRSQQLLEDSNFMTPLHRRPMWNSDIWDVVQSEFDNLIGRDRRGDMSTWRYCGRDEQREERDGWRQGVLFDEQERLFRPYDRNPPRIEFEDAEFTSSEQNAEKRRKPDTYEEWLSSVQSAVSQAAPSLLAMTKLARDAWAEAQKTTGDRGHTNSPMANTQANSRTEESTEEHTDDYGNCHMRRTVRTLNENGEEVRREVYVRVRSLEDLKQGDGAPCTKQLEDAARSEEGRDNKSSDRSGSGWFWK